MGQAALDYLLRLRVVVGIVALDQRYGLGEDRYVAGQNARDILVDRHGAALALDEMGVDYGFVVDALGHVEGAVVVHVEILFLVMFYLRE